jgi:hypothetical protein
MHSDMHPEYGMLPPELPPPPDNVSEHWHVAAGQLHETA